MSLADRKDALPGFFLRQLEDIEAEVQREEYPEMAFADGKVLPVDIQNKPGIRTTTYRQITAVGRFKLHRSYATDVPMINVLSKEFTQQIHKFAGGYFFSDDDVDAAKVANDFPLEQEHISSVREVAMREMNSLMATGIPDINMPGLLNHPDILRSYSPVAFNATASPVQILTAMNDAVTSQVNQTLRVEQPDTLFLPPTQYDYVATTNRTDTTDRTILEQFLAASPYIKNVEPLIECAGAGPAGEDVMLTLRRDRRKLKAMIIEDFKFLELEREGLGFKRPAVFRYAGIRLYRPYSVHLTIGV